jgi:hypothetical protein
LAQRVHGTTRLTERRRRWQCSRFDRTAIE